LQTTSGKAATLEPGILQCCRRRREDRPARILGREPRDVGIHRDAKICGWTVAGWFPCWRSIDLAYPAEHPIDRFETVGAQFGDDVPASVGGVQSAHRRVARKALSTSSVRLPSTATVIRARIRWSSACGLSLTGVADDGAFLLHPARRFCTVPRATRRVLASAATGRRAFSRSSDRSSRSVASIQNVNIACRYAQYSTLIDQFSVCSFGRFHPETSDWLHWGKSWSNTSAPRACAN